MRRSIRALLCALCGLGVLLLNGERGSGDVGVRTARADEATPNASDCMSFQNDVQEKTIVVHASNVCERKLSCSMSYVVRCEDNGGKKTSSTNGSAHFALAAHAAADVPMSAEQCKQGWSIDDVSWVCR
jgi:hypothetical protein